MIGVVTYWDEQVLADSKILDTDIWKSTVKPLDATHLLVVDESDLKPEWGDLAITYEIYPTLDAVMSEYPEATYVYLEASRNIPDGIEFDSLSDFIHPAEDVIYIVGPDSSVLPIGSLPMDGNHVVSISTVDGFALWSVVVAGIVLYDRKVKGGY